MSGASSSPDTPSDSASPKDQSLVELEETRMTESDEENNDPENEDKEETHGSVEANGPTATEVSPASLVLGSSIEPDSAAEVQARPESQPNTDGPAQEQNESSSQVHGETRVNTGSQAHSLAKQHEKEDGSVTQPYSVEDETTDKNNNGNIPVPDTVIDGRAKQNPIPNKYVAKASKRDGNFGVMQMGHGRAFMDARDLAAKRSSEATQAAAEEAVRAGNNGMARRKHVWKPADANMAAPPPPQQHHQHHQPSNQYPPHPGYYPPPMAPPPGGLSLADIKGEQARLLTFLRGIHPVIVVDQLCKALAYFGGIPGAPIPQDHGAFPQSAKANGPGMLLVGWLSEIFPPADYTKPPFSNFPHDLPNMGHGYAVPLNQNAPPRTNPEPAPSPASVPTPVSKPELPRARAPKRVDPNAPPRRKRGRPKGSKNSKFRKDKGVKRVTLTPGDVPPHPDGTPWKPGDPNPMVDLTQDTNSSLPAQTPEKTPNRPAASQSQADTGPAGADLSAPGLASVTPENRKRGRPFGTKTHARAVPTPNLPKLPDISSRGPDVAESPSAGVSLATGDASSTPHQSPQKAASSQKEASLPEHAQTCSVSSSSVPRRPHPDSTSVAASQAGLRPAAQAAPPPAPTTASSSEHSQSNDSRKRKLQHSPLALPTPITATPPQTIQHQLGQSGSEEANAQAKRRRTANGTSQTSLRSSPNPQSQAPAASANSTSNNTSSTSISANSRPSDDSHKVPAAKPDAKQAPPPQEHQPQQQPSLVDGQYQSQQSPPLNRAQNNMQGPQQGPYAKQPHQRYYNQRQQPQQQHQHYAQEGFQQQRNNANFGGTSGMNNSAQYPYDNDDYMNPNPYAVSARRAMEDASSFDSQPMYGQFGRR